ncbi:MAG TPA: ABC transporter permease [Sphingobacteriaceae bacterium]
MQAFILSIRSEFYKSRKTLALWSAVILPVVICSLVCFGYFSNSAKLVNTPAMVQWLRYMGSVMGVMGILLLPMFVIFTTYSVNNLEHRSEMWKSLFSLPLNKWSIYSSKYFFTVILHIICLALFASMILATGNLLGTLKPELKFQEYSVSTLAYRLHLKLFLSSLGIISIQFLLSLIWSDFLKPMGLGFIGTIMGLIAANTGWKYAYTIPYAHPALALQLNSTKGKVPSVDLFTKEIGVSLAVAVIAYILGYFIVARRSVK